MDSLENFSVLDTSKYLTYIAHLSTPAPLSTVSSPHSPMGMPLLTDNLLRSWIHQCQCHPAQEVWNAKGRGRAESK